MGKIIDSLLLIRVLNCLLASAGVLIGAHLTWLQPAYYGPMVASMVAFLVCAAGNVLNDICDLEADRINHPYRVLVSGSLSPRTAWIIFGFCNSSAIGLACLVNRPVLLIAILAIVLLVLYNLYLKRIPLVGNIAVATLSGLTFMTGGLAVDYPLAMTLPGPLIPAIFAFLFHLVREIIKDVQDMAGDRQAGVTTLPHLIGASASLLVSLGLFFLLTLLTAIPVLTGWFDKAYEIIVIYMVDLPLLVLLIFIWGNPTSGLLKAGSIGLKIGMLLGLIALMVS